MPTVPRIDGPQVNLRGVGGQVRARATEANGLADGLRQFGGEFAQYAVEEKQKADSIAITDVQAQAGKRKNDLLYDPETGLMNQKGKNAFGVSDQFNSQFDSWASETEQGLANAEQKAAFKKITQSMRLQAQAQLDRHTSAQMQVYDQQATESGLETSRNTAALNYTDPKIVGQEIDRQRAIIASSARRNGLPEDAVANAVSEATTATHEAVIDRMLADGKYYGAKQYLDANKGDISGTRIDDIEAAVRTGTVRAMSQGEADRIVGQYSSESAALKAAREISDPDVRDSVVQRVKTRFGERQQMADQYKTQLFNGAMDRIEMGGTTDDISPKQWMALSVSQRRALEVRQKQKQEGREPETDFGLYYDLEQTASANPREFAQVDLMQYRTRLDDSDFKSLSRLQASARGDASVDDLLQVQTKKDVVDGALGELGIEPNAKEDTKAGKRSVQFRRKVDERLRLLQEREGRKATTEDVQRITDDLIVQGSVPGTGWFGSDYGNESKPVFEASPEELQQMVIEADDVPAAKRQQIEAALQRNGRMVTEEAVTELYRRALISRGAQ